MSKPTLLSLPAEIRNKIWEDVVILKGSIALTSKSPGITQVNRQTQSETRTMYFSSNKFDASEPGLCECYLDEGFCRILAAKRMLGRLISLGPHACGAIACLNVEAFTCYECRLYAKYNRTFRSFNSVFTDLGFNPRLDSLKVDAICFPGGTEEEEAQVKYLRKLVISRRGEARRAAHIFLGLILSTALLVGVAMMLGLDVLFWGAKLGTSREFWKMVGVILRIVLTIRGHG